MKKSGYFISHSRHDKAFARRVASWLEVRGARVWFDESDAVFEDRLSSELKRAIDSCDTFIIIASEEAVQSNWVKLELAHATRRFQMNRPRVRVLYRSNMDDLKEHPLLNDSPRVDMSDPLEFHNNTYEILGVTKETVICDKDVLARKLRYMTAVSPQLKPLIDVAFENKPVHIAQTGTLLSHNIQYDDLEFCLEAGAILAWDQQDSFYRVFAADAFERRGAGLAIIDQSILPEVPKSNGCSALVYAMQELPEIRLDCALKMLRNADPPDDQASADFIRRNFEKCNGAQRDQLVDIVTDPHRGPGSFGRDAAFYLYRNLPDNDDLYALWHFWIHEGDFEGSKDDSATTSDFFRLISDDLREGRGPWEKLLPVIEGRVRSLVRRRDEGSVWKAIGYLVKASEANFPHMQIIFKQLQTPSWAEWNNWEGEYKMTLALNIFVQEAKREKNWLRAYDKFKNDLKDQAENKEIFEKWFPGNTL
ncbi:MAG: toll/interleukin-1 receptor domain-containing protein [Pseudomonadota bacterium]